MHTVYINNGAGECIATIFAEHGVEITADDFLQALPESQPDKTAFYDSEHIIKVGFPIIIKKTFTLYVK
ncbi:MAG: hypothetical protein LBM41_07410 [Ruminococcus sp.]|jgi:hypothetical protein|nr:hypothetical protein [Ruminococcus sp.]